MKTFRVIALSLGVAGSPALAQPAPPFARQPADVIVPTDPADREEQSDWGYADAVIDGDHVWLSGVVASLRAGETMADQEAAYHRAFRGLDDILKRAGSSFDGVVEISTFHTDLPAQIEAFKRVKHRYICAPFAAWTAIGVTRLVPARGLVEIKLVARRRPADLQ